MTSVRRVAGRLSGGGPGRGTHASLPGVDPYRDVPGPLAGTVPDPHRSAPVPLPSPFPPTTPRSGRYAS